MYLFGSLWYRWTTAFKVATPILHIAFSAAQLHGSNILRKLWLRHRRILREMQACADGEDCRGCSRCSRTLRVDEGGRTPEVVKQEKTAVVQCESSAALPTL